ncbi:MAG TPA: porin [Hanamia sp.]|nr:porin [Hanamia sp.]
MKKIISSTTFIFLFVFFAHAQHQHHNKQDTTNSKNARNGSMQMNEMRMDSTKMNGMKMNNMDMNSMNMSHSFSLNLPMSRNGSGTAWLPDASPMYGVMYHSKNWMYMLHGSIFLRYDNQDFSKKGSRGDEQIDAPNWLMLMGQRQVGQNGLFHFGTMFSLDVLTVGGGGYPLLFQSGESWKGRSLVDRQHPHDLFSELSIAYSKALSKKSDVYLYLGYPGEPALGPVAFMHRPSAMDNPDAPISHHWIDATHITFGVATLGVRYGNFKIEGSSFTGREPDENRYNLDKPLFDSWSGRLSYNPSQNWALQVSHGFIKSPEALHPEEDVNRSTASAIYSLPTNNNGTFNATAVWGMNKTKGKDGENAVSLEGEWRKNKLGLYGRYDYVQKNVEELVLDENVYGVDAVFPVNAFTLGFNYDLFKIGKANVAGGGQFSLYHADSRLDNLYGKNPMAFEVFLRLYPGRMKMK